MLPVVSHKALSLVLSFSLLTFMIYLIHHQKLYFYLFADDANIYCEGENLHTLQKTVNKEMKKVKIWHDANKLALNIDKTNYLFLSLLSILLLILLISKLEIFQLSTLSLYNFLAFC